MTPSDAAQNEVSATTTSNEGARQYSVSGLDNDETYDIVLYPAANVTEDENGVVTFRDADGAGSAGNGEADRGTPVGVIEVINGVAVTTPSPAEEAAPSQRNDLLHDRLD